MTSRSFLVVLLFSLVLSFGLLCSAADPSGRRREEDPARERRFKQEQREQEEKEERWSHRDPNPEDPRMRFEECRERCHQEGQRQQPQCQQQCRREFQELQECQQSCKQEEQRPERKQQCLRQCREKLDEKPLRNGGNYRREEEEEWEEERQSHNPYYFPRRKYAHARYQEDNGIFWVLQKFSQKHKLLKGIDEYRFALIEANPNTFVLPHHCDAEKIYFVTRGKGTLTFLTQKKKESYNLVPGVVVKVPTGSTVYLVSQDEKEKLILAVLHRPVNNPGKFEEFFPAGQEQPQSYYQTFSNEILEAVFNGSIFVPHYNSMSTFVIFVTKGDGYVEMVCPHLSSQSSRNEEEEEGRSGEYKQVKAQLSAGDVYVVPAGHPVTYYASQNQHLRFMAFGLNHRNNTRNFIAGKDNMMKQMDSEAKELSFGVPSKLIDEVFNSPKESHFVSGQSQQSGGDEETGSGIRCVPAAACDKTTKIGQIPPRKLTVINGAHRVCARADDYMNMGESHIDVPSPGGNSVQDSDSRLMNQSAEDRDVDSAHRDTADNDIEGARIEQHVHDENDVVDVQQGLPQPDLEDKHHHLVEDTCNIFLRAKVVESL
ncbi:Vicilin GC72-A [Hibiscus syriacus]|uniref:Vicilin GC72-A n=1 Tax=Hibiscus syriacus TaxID=106335 RepID=A0A6A2WRA1_HIBSY|nr:Vicilin GC72-A [Hibiscus syriacus]